MGSVLLTMNQCAATTLVLSVLVSFCPGEGREPLRWMQSKGSIPANGVVMTRRGKTPHYWCRVTAEGAISYGVLRQNQTCMYADKDHQTIMSSSTFDILVSCPLLCLVNRRLGSDRRPS